MSKDLDNVTTLSDPNVRTYGEEPRTRKDPFKFRLPGSPEFTVEEPDSDTVMDIEEATTSRRVLKLFLGEQYDDVADYLGPTHPDTLIDLARDLSRHFGLFDAEQAVSRSERRSRDRRRGTARR